MRAGSPRARSALMQTYSARTHEFCALMCAVSLCNSSTRCNYRPYVVGLDQCSSTGVVIEQYLSSRARGGRAVLQLELTQDGYGCFLTAVSSDSAACGRRTFVWRCLFRLIMDKSRSSHTSLSSYSVCNGGPPMLILHRRESHLSIGCPHSYS